MVRTVYEQVQQVSNYKSRSGVMIGTVAHSLGGSSKHGDMEIEYPNKDVLKTKKIIVSTLVNSGR